MCGIDSQRVYRSVDVLQAAKALYDAVDIPLLFERVQGLCGIRFVSVASSVVRAGMRLVRLAHPLTLVINALPVTSLTCALLSVPLS